MKRNRADPVAETNRTVVQRKFPGPAGLLQDFPPPVKFDKNCDSPQMPISQATFHMFDQGPWAALKDDLIASQCPLLIDTFNIKWLQNHSQRYRNKSPFLAAVIQHIDGSGSGKLSNVNVTLRDPSGQIEATVMNSVLELYGEHLVIGAVLVLRLFSVLSTGNVNNSYIITVTPKNLVRIYTTHTNCIRVQSISNRDLELLCDQFQPVNRNDLFDDIDFDSIFDD